MKRRSKSMLRKGNLENGSLHVYVAVKDVLDIATSNNSYVLLIMKCDVDSKVSVLPFPSQVVYNRVGKCGSRTVVLLLRILSEKHGFNLVTSDIHNKTRLTKNEQIHQFIHNGNLGADVAPAGPIFFPSKVAIGVPSAAGSPNPIQHSRSAQGRDKESFVLLPPPCIELADRFGGDQPVYINIIRDPVNRFLSNYFFRRFGDWRGEQNHMIRTPSMRQEERYLLLNYHNGCQPLSQTKVLWQKVFYKC
ncbi:uronyl 2- hypothetical protein [Limosa lapponica baueri]|uniref:Uronyl 2-sulfotransferase n=1 Tax=Limosa lapponica baueri TaxID=1758121 RepID=A0A2I0TKZ2_LIMLA|nr:uronyl 2- hypothetical protein [Limosa lapponica baueri]